MKSADSRPAEFSLDCGKVAALCGSNSSLRQTLDARGWASVSAIPQRAFMDLVRELGVVGETTRLTPRDSSQAGRASLSGRHGLAEFPFHTDGASRHHPPAYVALWSARPWKTATLLLDGSADTLNIPVFSRSWVVSVGGSQGRFYAIPRLRIRGQVSWRLNTDCMSPAVGVFDGADLHRRFQAAEPVRLAWSADSAVIIDNRRILHSREAISAGEADRELLRVEVLDDMVR